MKWVPYGTVPQYGWQGGWKPQFFIMFKALGFNMVYTLCNLSPKTVLVKSDDVLNMERGRQGLKWVQ